MLAPVHFFTPTHFLAATLSPQKSSAKITVIHKNFGDLLAFITSNEPTLRKIKNDRFFFFIGAQLALYQACGSVYQ
jgi:hypothetical protein